MYEFAISIYLNEFKGGMTGPIIWADNYKEAQGEAQRMYPHAWVVVERV